MGRVRCGMRIFGAHVNRGTSAASQLPPSITAPERGLIDDSATGGSNHMTKKTRIRVARIAAGAVIAAGASLTVAGVASAAGDEGGLSGLVSTSGGDVDP